jgi:hypothetical protein
VSQLAEACSLPCLKSTGLCDAVPLQTRGRALAVDHGAVQRTTRLPLPVLVGLPLPGFVGMLLTIRQTRPFRRHSFEIRWKLIEACRRAPQCHHFACVSPGLCCARCLQPPPFSFEYRVRSEEHLRRRHTRGRTHSRAARPQSMHPHAHSASGFRWRIHLVCCLSEAALLYRPWRSGKRTTQVHTLNSHTHAHTHACTHGHPLFALGCACSLPSRSHSLAPALAHARNRTRAQRAPCRHSAGIHTACTFHATYTW